MPKPVLQWFDTDGETPLGRLNLGVVGPGQSYHGRHDGYRQVVLKNTGDLAADEIELVVQAAGSHDLYTFLRVATGATEPDAIDFVDHTGTPLPLGSLAPDATLNVWLDAIVPAFAPRRLGTAGNIVLGYVDGV